MPKTRSYYDVLGIRETATQKEIRDAYVRLIKQSHPDTQRDRGCDTAFVELLNRCYATLRDPEKRSAYDAALRMLPAVVLPRLPTAGRASKKRDRLVQLTSLASLAGATVLIAVSLHLPTKQIRNSFIESAGDWSLETRNRHVPSINLATPSRAESEQIAASARKSSLSDAEHFSRSCFQTTKKEALSGDSHRCIIFDWAFVYWHKPADGFQSSVYFSDPLFTSRHKAALVRHGPESQNFLTLLRENAYRALLDHIQNSARESEDLSASPVESVGDREAPSQTGTSGDIREMWTG